MAPVFSTLATPIWSLPEYSSRLTKNLSTKTVKKLSKIASEIQRRLGVVSDHERGVQVGVLHILNDKRVTSDKNPFKRRNRALLNGSAVWGHQPISKPKLILHIDDPSMLKAPLSENQWQTADTTKHFQEC